MGIDIYLKWDGMDSEDEKNQITGFSTTSGNVGYLREAYHGGPYATKMLVREAFESEDGTAKIPAAVMRERLTYVTEPARGCDEGHNMAELIMNLLGASGADVVPAVPKSGRTTPMTVEEAIRIRCETVYPESGEEYVQQVLKSFRDFVALAEQKEKETNEPCTVIASY